MKKKGDISKQLYKFQEGITAIALELAGYPENLVHWPTSERPEGLTVNVDVLIGTTPKASSINISVKHWTGDKNSETAGWRMMREIIDSKANCNIPIRVYNILFDDSIKNNWANILAAYFDGFLVLPSESGYGPILVSKAYEYCKGPLHGIKDAKARIILRQAVTPRSLQYDEELAFATVALGQRLKNLFAENRPSLDSFWQRINVSCNRPLPTITPKWTSFKRGLAKLLIFEFEDRKKIYAKMHTGDPILNLPKYALDLGLAGEGMEGDWEIIDKDILNLFVYLPKDAGPVCEYIYSRAPVERMDEKYINPLREISNVLVFNQYIINNFETLKTGQGMLDSLTKCYEEPMNLLQDFEIVGTEKSVWLYTALMATLKSTGGTHQSSGLTTLVNETGIDPLRARFDLPAFVYREKPLDDLMMEIVSNYFADKLAQLGISEFISKREEIPIYYKQRLLETQLVPYKQFDPIGIILKRKLNEHCIGWIHHSNHSTAAKEFARVETGGTTKALEICGTIPILVMWQSPNKNARDKAKEFAARVACLASRYDFQQKIFVDRGVKIYMIIDGIWDQEDILSLLRFGCEKVFYPDEVEQMVEEISKMDGIIKVNIGEMSDVVEELHETEESDED